MARDEEKELLDKIKGDIHSVKPIGGDPNIIYGCTNPEAVNYNPRATVDDGSCSDYQGDIVYGCTDPKATNYNPRATADDGSCLYGEIVYGCTDPNATNYNPKATVDDGSCIDPVLKTYWICDPGTSGGGPVTPAFGVGVAAASAAVYTNQIGCKSITSFADLYEPEYFSSKQRCLEAVAAGESICDVDVDEEDQTLKIDGVPVFTTPQQCLKWGKHYGFPTDFIYSIIPGPGGPGGPIGPGGPFVEPVQPTLLQKYENVRRVYVEPRPWENFSKFPLYGGYGILGKIFPIFTNWTIDGDGGVSFGGDDPLTFGGDDPRRLDIVNTTDVTATDIDVVDVDVDTEEPDPNKPTVFMAGPSKILAKWAVSNGPSYSESEKELSSRVQWLFNSQKYILFNYDVVQEDNG